MWNRVNRGLPPEMKNESLKRGETTSRRKGEILQSWRDTCVVNMISTIYDSTVVDVPWRIVVSMAVYRVTSHVNKPNLPLPSLALRRQTLLADSMAPGLNPT